MKSAQDIFNETHKMILFDSGRRQPGSDAVVGGGLPNTDRARIDRMNELIQQQIAAYNAILIASNPAGETGNRPNFTGSGLGSVPSVLTPLTNVESGPSIGALNITINAPSNDPAKLGQLIFEDLRARGMWR